MIDYHQDFASVYDTMYRTRDICGEVEQAIDLLHLGEQGGGECLLDFGCGTGSHVLAFAERGIATTGFDVSEAMVGQARCKPVDRKSAAVTFVAGDFERLCQSWNGERFTAVSSFFNVLNCCPTPATMLFQLKLIRSRMAPGAMGLLELWNGAAVFSDQPHPSVRHYCVGDGSDCEITRITEPKLDRINQVCTLAYRILTLDKAAGTYSEFESVHRLRFLTPVQYRHMFELAELEIVDECPKGAPGKPITDHDWYICYIVRAGR